MAKVGNKGGGAVNNTKGPCSKCGTIEGPFHPVKVHSATGKRSMQRYCNECQVKV